MLFVKNAINLMGNKILIFNLKMNEFHKQNTLTIDDFQIIYNIINDNEEINEIVTESRKSLLLCSFYYIMNSNKKAQKEYQDRYLNFYDNENSQSLLNLYLLFNIIELECKYRKRDTNELKKLYNELNIYLNSSKFVEDYLLMKYYLALLKNLIEEYQESNVFCSDIIATFSEYSKTLQNNFSTYIHSRIIYLKIQNYEKLEKEQNSPAIKNEIIDHLDNLFEIIKNTDENLAVKIGLKMSFYQNLINKSSNCIKTLELIMNIIHKQMISGKQHPNLINQFLYFSSLLAYNNTLLSNLSELKRYTKKLNNNIKIFETFKSNNDLFDNSNINYFPIYKFLFVLFSEIARDKLLSEETKNKYLEEYKDYLGDSIKMNDGIILNMWILTKNNLPFYSNLFEEKINNYYNDLKAKKKFKNDDYLNFFFYIYNKISLLTRQYNKNPQEETLKKAQAYSKSFIDYIFENISKESHLKYLFQLNYCKDMFNRIYFVYIYTFFLMKNYKETLKLIDNFFNVVKFQLELNISKGIGYLKIQKMKGDFLFMTEKYEDAIKEYKNILSIYNKYDGLILCNLGLCYAFIGQKSLALKNLENSKKHLSQINSTEKIKEIDKIIQ
jgi:hypothetical protein